MDRSETTNDRVVADRDVSGECPVIGKNDGIADRAIVADVAVSEKIPAITNARLACAGCAAIDGDKFPERIFIADFKISRFALIFQILCLLADRAVSVEFIPRAGPQRPTKCDVMLQPAIRPQDHSGRDDAIRPDNCAGADFRLRIHDGGRVDLHITH